MGGEVEHGAAGGGEVVAVAHGTAAWRDTVALRRLVLRTPLGLDFTPGELAAENGQVHLARRCGRALAGVCVLVPGGARWKLRQMAVAPAWQGRGIGRDLVRAAEAAALEAGAGEMVLHAREAAAGFYARLGYAAEGERFDEVGLPHRRMRRALGSGGAEEAGGLGERAPAFREEAVGDLPDMGHHRP